MSSVRAANGRSPTWPIVPRDDLLAEFLHGLVGSPSQGASLVGPAGVGKSVLARQLTEQLSQAETVTVIGLTALSGCRSVPGRQRSRRGSSRRIRVVQ
jgi:DNA replication protein DnaC